MLESVLNVLEENIDAVDDSADPVLFEPAKHVIDVYYGLEQENLIHLMNIHGTVPNTVIDQVGAQFEESICEQVNAEDTLKEINDSTENFLKCASYAVSVAQTTKRVHDSNNIVYNVMGEENMEHFGLYSSDNPWIHVANSYKDLSSIAITDLVMKVEEALFEKWEEFTLETLLNLAAGGEAGKLGLDLGRLIVKLDPVCVQGNNAIKADLRAMFLSELQLEVRKLLIECLKDIVEEPNKQEHYQRYVQAQLMYCRTSIAMYNSLIEATRVLTMGTNDAVELFQKKVDLLSIYMYRLTALQYDNYHKCIPTDLSVQNNATSFSAAIESVKDTLNYQDYSRTQKDYCRGDFFKIDGRNALVLLYLASKESDLKPGYYVDLWTENQDGAIALMTRMLLKEVSNPDDIYASVNIREIDGKQYLNAYVSTTSNKTIITEGKYHCIDNLLMLEFDLYSEYPYISIDSGLRQPDDSRDAKYLVNHETVSGESFYSLQDELNYDNIVTCVCPYADESGDVAGRTFEDLLEQIKNMDAQVSAHGQVAESYKWALKQHPEAYSYQLTLKGEKKTFTTPTEYTLYDIDKNKIPELIVRVNHNYYYIYTFDGKTAVLCTGDNYWPYSGSLRMYDGNGLLVYDGGMGSLHLEYVSRYELNGSSFKSVELMYDGELESHEKLHECLDQYAPISDYRVITDLSLLES